MKRLSIIFWLSTSSLKLDNFMKYTFFTWYIFTAQNFSPFSVTKNIKMVYNDVLKVMLSLYFEPKHNRLLVFQVKHILYF